MEIIKGIVGFMVIGIILCFVLGGYFMPTIIAIVRKHHFKWVIFAINLIFGITGMGYLIALAWAVWPRASALFDPLWNDMTTNRPMTDENIIVEKSVKVTDES